MKKAWIIIALVLLLTGCSVKSNQKPIAVRGYENIASSGVWLSYSELNKMLGSNGGFKSEFEAVITNLKQLKIQNLYIHIRPFCDSLYKSSYYPLMQSAAGYDFDILEYVIDQCHTNGIKVHAWINPYRVSTATTDVSSLDKNSQVYKWANDQITQNDRNICIYNGIYLNPSEAEVQRLVIDGIREVINNYKVDGIHFDDYFYPTTDPQFDKSSYDEYIKGSSTPLSLADWRRNNVNSLISASYNAIKYLNEDIIFTVSPAASIEQNYNNLYADIKEWLKGGYIDYIIPQLYFGFEYPDSDFRFENLVKSWKKAVENCDVGLIIGLAPYKAIPELLNDKEEWENNSDIISRQLKICKNDSLIQGYVYFSYSSLVDLRQPFVNQRENIENMENGNE